jgi:hypothetical protein
VISSLTTRATLDELVFGRRIVRIGTLVITVPGLLLAITGRVGLAFTLKVGWQSRSEWLVATNLHKMLALIGYDHASIEW